MQPGLSNVRGDLTHATLARIVKRLYAKYWDHCKDHPNMLVTLSLLIHARFCR